MIDGWSLLSSPERALPSVILQLNKNNGYTWLRVSQLSDRCVCDNSSNSSNSSNRSIPPNVSVLNSAENWPFWKELQCQTVGQKKRVCLPHYMSRRCMWHIWFSTPNWGCLQSRAGVNVCDVNTDCLFLLCLNLNQFCQLYFIGNQQLKFIHSCLYCTLSCLYNSILLW